MPQLTTLRRARLGSKPLKCDLHKLSVKVREAFGLLCSASCGGIPAARRLRVSCLGVALSGGNGVKWATWADLQEHGDSLPYLESATCNKMWCSSKEVNLIRERSESDQPCRERGLLNPYPCARQNERKQRWLGIPEVSIQTFNRVKRYCR